METSRGAVDLSRCPQRLRGILRSSYCRCRKCSVCGFPKHTGVHGPVFGKEPGTKPWGHKFSPINSEGDKDGNALEDS